MNGERRKVMDAESRQEFKEVREELGDAARQSWLAQPCPPQIGERPAKETSVIASDKRM